MSFVTNANQAVSNVAIRLGKLQNLYQVLTKNEPAQNISEVFTNLEKIDRHAVRTMSSAETIGRKYIINKIAMRNAVERHMGALKKADQAFQTGVVKDQTKSQGTLSNSSKQQSKNPLIKLTQDVLAEYVLPFLTREEATNLQTACVGYSSLTASRFHRLNNLSQAIVQDQAKIPVLFQELHKEDRTRILDKFKKETFDWNQMKEHKKPLLKEIELMKAEHSFTIPSSKSLVNHLPKLPIPLMSAKALPFLSREEATNFQTACVGYSSLTASRFHRLNKLSQAIVQDQAKIPVLFQELHKEDRMRILGKFKKETFDWNQMKEYKEPLLKEIEAMKAARSFTIPSSKSLANYLKKLPISVMSAFVGSFLAEKERGDLRSSCRDTRKIQTPASSIIKNHKLEGLIETYLHVSSSALAPSDKAKTLHKLLSMAYSLSKIEKLPRPTYSSLPAFFQLAEARNLIRMVAKIHEEQPLPDLENAQLETPQDTENTLKRAQALRNWFRQHQATLQAFNKLNLEMCHLTLLPPEIGNFLALTDLDLYGNHLISLPKEIGKLKALSQLLLSSNRIKILPKEIGKLTALSKLWLTKNLT